MIVNRRLKLLRRREANKQATRAALRAAAKQLFTERGYAATTVRDIARAAHVTERTFYRYFDGKEGLIAHEYLSWLAILADAIRARPGDEPPFTAVRRAMISVGREASIADAILARSRALCGTGDGPADAEEEFRARVIARVAVAALRSAIIRHRELRARGEAAASGIEQLLDTAFAVISDQ